MNVLTLITELISRIKDLALIRLIILVFIFCYQALPLSFDKFHIF